MPRRNYIEVPGVIIEVMPNLVCRVELPNGHRILARVASQLRLNFIQILPGLKVLIEFSPYDLSHGRIVELIPKTDKV
jgi:translation initiation factor IF-1